MLDNSTCVLCHRNDLPLDIGHLISVHDGRALGPTDAELNSDENLTAMCWPCNSGVGSGTLPLRLVVAVLRARTARAKRRPA
jgi:5-methylcytosine-specific restriction endonuclease McrA